MKKIFTTRVKLIVLASILLAATVAISSAVMLDRAPALSSAVGFLVSPFRKGVAAVANKVGETYSYLYEYDALKAENEQLRLRLAEMEEQIRRSDENMEENTRLRKLLGFSQQNRDLTMEPASVLSWNLSNWESGFTISKGESAGVRAGMCVVSETGAVIGLVSHTGINWANVSTIIDVESQMGAMVFRTGDIGIAEGGFESMQNGTLRLSYLPSDAELRNGDEVVTTGGDLVPSGLVLGKVVDVRSEDSGLSKYAVIEPPAPMDGLTQVFVVTEFDIED